jgi:hypothetical protein
MSFILKYNKIPKNHLTKILSNYENQNFLDYLKKNWSRYPNLPSIILILLNKMIENDDEKRFEIFFNYYNSFRDFFLNEKYLNKDYLVHRAAYYCKPRLLKQLLSCGFDYSLLNSYNEDIYTCLESGYADKKKKNLSDTQLFFLDHWYEESKNILAMYKS